MLPALPSVLSDQIVDTEEFTSLPTMQVASVGREEPRADALYGSGGYENIISKPESREESETEFRKKWHGSELEAMERDARDQQFTADVHNRFEGRKEECEVRLKHRQLPKILT